MSLRARVKQEPGVGDQVCIKQEPELNDADWGTNEAGCWNSESEYAVPLVKEEPAPLDQEPMSALQEWIYMQQDIFNPTVSNEPGLVEEPVWMGGSGAHTPDTPEVKREEPLQPPARLPPAPPAPAPLDGKYSCLVRECRVRLERCAIPPRAVERYLARRQVARLTATAASGRLTVTAASGRLTATAASGRLTVTAASGRLTATAASGRLTVTAASGRLTVTAASSRPRGRPPAPPGPLERHLAMTQLSGLIKTKHKRKNLYICHICKKEFVSLPNFTAHKQVHMKNDAVIPVFRARPGVAPAKPYLCEICKAGFDDLKTLKVHAVIHANFGKTPYACEICNIRFASVHQFNSHGKSHAELRPFPCRVCQKRFARKSDLGRHMFHHKLERNMCKACEERRALRLLGTLMLRSEDLDEDTDRCEACGRDT